MKKLSEILDSVSHRITESKEGSDGFDSMLERSAAAPSLVKAIVLAAMREASNQALDDAVKHGHVEMVGKEKLIFGHRIDKDTILWLKDKIED